MKTIGNIFIALSFLIVLFIYYPVIVVYLFSPKEPVVKSSFSIEIPKIKLNSPVIANVNPFNKPEYKKALEMGIAHARGTALPGEKGTIYLFGHSSGLPWELTRYNTVFLKLGELTKGDIIILRRNDKGYKYIVFDKKTVWPNQVKYLMENKINQLILQTCTPIGTDLQRLLVFAKPQ